MHLAFDFHSAPIAQLVARSLGKPCRVVRGDLTAVSDKVDGWTRTREVRDTAAELDLQRRRRFLFDAVRLPLIVTMPSRAAFVFPIHGVANLTIATPRCRGQLIQLAAVVAVRAHVAFVLTCPSLVSPSALLGSADWFAPRNTSRAAHSAASAFPSPWRCSAPREQSLHVPADLIVPAGLGQAPRGTEHPKRGYCAMEASRSSRARERIAFSSRIPVSGLVWASAQPLAPRSSTVCVGWRCVPSVDPGLSDDHGGDHRLHLTICRGDPDGNHHGCLYSRGPRQENRKSDLCRCCGRRFRLSATTEIDDRCDDTVLALAHSLHAWRGNGDPATDRDSKYRRNGYIDDSRTLYDTVPFCYSGRRPPLL